MRSFRASPGHAEIEAIAAATLAMWGGGKSAAAYREHLREQISRSEGRMGYVALSEAGAIVCALKRYRLPARSSAGECEAIGIGAVFTMPAERKRGLAAELIGELLARARDERIGFAYLFSDIDPAYYARLGFERLPALMWQAPVSELPHEGALATAPSSDLERIAELHRACAATNELVLAKTPAAWRYLAWRNGPVAPRILFDGGRAVGYVALARAGELLRVVDDAISGVPRERWWATLRELAREAGCTRVGGWLRDEWIGTPFVATPPSECVPMVARLGASSGKPYFSELDHI